MQQMSIWPDTSSRVVNFFPTFHHFLSLFMLYFFFKEKYYFKKAHETMRTSYCTCSKSKLQKCETIRLWKLILVIIIFYWNKISLKFLTFYKDIFPCQNELLKTQCKFHTKVLATYYKKYTLLKYHNLIAIVSFKLDVAKLQLFK